MARTTKTVICDDCGVEFDVIADSYDDIMYCCFCGAEIESQDEWGEEEE